MDMYREKQDLRELKARCDQRWSDYGRSLDELWQGMGNGATFEAALRAYQHAWREYRDAVKEHASRQSEEAWMAEEEGR